MHGFSTGGNRGIRIPSAGGSFVLENSIFYAGHDGIRVDTAAGTGTVNNSTIHGMAGKGIALGLGSLTVTNTIVMDSVGLDFDGAMTQSFNMSSDATAAGTGSLTNKLAANQFVSIAAGTEDFHLKAGADAIDVGDDLSSSFTDDIDAESRGAAWDMGADETSAAAAACDVDSNGTYIEAENFTGTIVQGTATFTVETTLVGHSSWYCLPSCVGGVLVLPPLLRR